MTITNVTWDFAYNESLGPSAYPARTAISEALSRVGAQFMRDGSRWLRLGASLTEAACCPDTEQEAIDIANQYADLGVGVMYLIISLRRVYNEGGGTTNWGLMQHATSEGITDNSFNAARMNTFCRLITQLQARGVDVMVDINTYGPLFIRLGQAQGTNEGYASIFLIPSLRQVFITSILDFLDYTNPHTGRKIGFEPGVQIKVTNEASLKDSMRRSTTTNFGGGRTGAATG